MGTRRLPTREACSCWLPRRLRPVRSSLHANRARGSQAAPRWRRDKRHAFHSREAPWTLPWSPARVAKRRSECPCDAATYCHRSTWSTSRRRAVEGHGYAATTTQERERKACPRAVRPRQPCPPRTSQGPNLPNRGSKEWRDRARRRQLGTKDQLHQTVPLRSRISGLPRP